MRTNTTAYIMNAKRRINVAAATNDPWWEKQMMGYLFVNAEGKAPKLATSFGDLGIFPGDIMRGVQDTGLGHRSLGVIRCVGVVTSKGDVVVVPGYEQYLDPSTRAVPHWVFK